MRNKELVYFKLTVILQPNWPVVYSGETISLRCEIEGGEGTQWTYEWRPTNRNSPTSSEYRIDRVSESDNGEYSCMVREGDRQLTEWSDAVTLTVRCESDLETVLLLDFSMKQFTSVISDHRNV
uniref:Ig-like domain-containing protein n=1 Tax=Poecilia latipinna TaxID=48699 RepID=A0A3B3VIU6_9TELE